MQVLERSSRHGTRCRGRGEKDRGECECGSMILDVSQFFFGRLVGREFNRVGLSIRAGCDGAVLRSDVERRRKRGGELKDVMFRLAILNVSRIKLNETVHLG